MFERFNQDARRVVVGAQEQARELQHNYIGTEHLLLGLFAPPGDAAASRALRQLGYTAQSCRAAVEAMIGPGSCEPSGSIPFTPRSKKVLELSLRESLRLKQNEIGTEHILLAILREGGGVAAQILTQGGASLDMIRETVLKAAASGRGASATGETMTPAAEEVLARANRLAGGAPVGSHHLLEALFVSGDSMAGRALAALGVDADAVTGQVDALDIDTTSDVTAEQIATGQMRMRVVGDEVHLILCDPTTVERVRSAVTAADGELRGDGLLTGPFIALRRAVHGALDAVVGILGTGESEGPGPAARASARDRLRRRRR
ncbi:MAG: Clp protease N-terminal domain-containing protein [Pseudonocardia sp.]